jgi:hypothetical protein
MKHLVLLIVVMVTGCAAQNDVWFKPDVSRAALEQAELSCAAQALALFPRPSRLPPRGRASVTVGGGFCTGPVCVNAARPLGPAPVSDPDARLRAASNRQCLQAMGYRQSRVPVCGLGSASAPLTRLPATVAGLCVANGTLRAAGR